MKNLMTVDNMKRAYALNQCRSNLWHSFRDMKFFGFITEKEWDEFESECEFWDCYRDPMRVVDADGNLIYNFETGEGTLDFNWDR